jgi:tetratricopeptide (TPR) repeat protein
LSLLLSNSNSAEKVISTPNPVSETNAAGQVSAQIESVRKDVVALRESVSETRRDQLNYQIERDLLKETYASNLQTINLIITIIFGFMAALVSILGYLGIKSIRVLRDDFAKELTEFRSTRSEIEEKLRAVIQKTEDASAKVATLSDKSAQQDERLATLEILEKASSLVGQKRYREALRYLDIALERMPDDDSALFQKAVCHLELREYAAAEVSYRRILNQVSADSSESFQSALTNVAELYALQGNDLAFKNLVERYGSRLGRDDPWLPPYLDVIKLVRTGNLGELKAATRALVTDLPADRLPVDWSFQEAQVIAAGWPNRVQELVILNSLISFLQKKLPAEQFIALLTPELASSGE